MSGITWDDLTITTIKLEGLPAGKEWKDLENGDKVVFTEEDGNEGYGASFLKDIKQDMNESNRQSYRVFTATFVSPSEAAKIANAGFGPGCTPFFYVHGFNSEPGYTLETIMPRAKKLCLVQKKFYPISVIWPVNGWYSGYNQDQNEYSLKAGVNLACLVNHIPNDLFPKKTLLCHSMGNHVVFNGASGQNLPSNPTGPPGPAPDVKFDNIFLCAADIENDAFSKNPRNGEFGHKEEKAENMKQMLHDGGKIYVIHCQDDIALQGSGSTLNGYPWSPNERLGLHGAKNLRAGFEGIVKNIDVKRFTDNNPDADDRKKHSYQFEDWCIKIYENPEQHVTS